MGGLAVQIRQMIATFGKLHQQRLELGDGLNLIYAPNESGKSTWCQFLRTMFYGFPPRERGEFADKNRFAPWDGSPMSGTMDVGDPSQGANRFLSANSPRSRGGKP